MKRNKKGFTLIELLAVIVILAIIALIATPIIMGVIEDARKGANKDAALGFGKAVETAIAKQMIKCPNLRVANSGVIEDADKITLEEGSCPDETNPETYVTEISIDYQGTKPTEPQLTYHSDTGKVTGHVKYGDQDYDIEDGSEYSGGD